MEVINESAIQIDRGTQFRARLNDDRVREYSELFTSKLEWPFDTPCEVFFDGSEYYLVDGFHRYHAARTAGFDGIVCNVRKGTLRDAIKFALSANAKHGLHRSNEDKRKAVAFALDDLEWRNLSSRMIADMCGVSQPFVDSLRKASESTDNGYQLSDKRVGKDGKARKTPEPKEETKVDPPKDVWGDIDDEPEEKPSKPLPKTTMSQSPQELVASIHAAGESLQSLVKEMNRLSDQVGGEWIDMQEVETRAKSLRKLIRGFAHWVDCPECSGKGCNGCKKRGWLCADRKQFLDQRQKDLLVVA